MCADVNIPEMIVMNLRLPAQRAGDRIVDILATVLITPRENTTRTIKDLTWSAVYFAIFMQLGGTQYDQAAI